MFSWGELFSTFMARKIMGVKGTCRSANGGGVPSFMLPFIIAKGLPSCLPSSSLVVNFQAIGANFQQNGAKVRFFLVCLGVFSGKSETKKGKNKNLFCFRGFCGAAFILFCGGGGGVHWWQVVGLFEASGPAEMPALVLWWCFPAFCPLCCFALGALLAIASKYALFRVFRAFLAWFGVQVYICMG